MNNHTKRLKKVLVKPEVARVKNYFKEKKNKTRYISKWANFM